MATTPKIFRLPLFKEFKFQSKITKDHVPLHKQGYVDTHATMKNFYKKAGIADLVVFGSLGVSFFAYLFYPHFGWWNLMLLLTGLGAGMVMGRLFYCQWKIKRKIEGENQIPKALYLTEEEVISEDHVEIGQDHKEIVPKPNALESRTRRAKVIEAFLTD